MCGEQEDAEFREALADFERRTRVRIFWVARVFSRSPFGSVHGTPGAAADAAGVAGFVERAIT
jgi:hypothetical protein